MDIKVRDAIKAIKKCSLIEDQNVQQIEIEALNKVKLDDVLGEKFVDVKFSENLRKPMERKLKVEYSYPDGERIEDAKEEIYDVVSYIRLNKFEAFEVMANPKEKVINWKKAVSVTGDYQKNMAAKFGDKYVTELAKYCDSQLVKRADVIAQIDDAFEKKLETVTLRYGSQEKTFSLKDDEQVLKAYRKKLASEARGYQKNINDVENFVENELKEKVD